MKAKRPLVSALLPSRKRADLALQSIKSLGADPRLETLLMIDPDDDIVAYEALLPYITTLYVAPRRYGYLGLHRYYNYLASHSNGDWLLLWNDDATMRTTDWLDRVAPHDAARPQVLNPCDGQNILPIVSRSFYATFPHFSLSPLNDAWVTEIAAATGCHVKMDSIEVVHDNQFQDALNDELGDVRSEALAKHFSPQMQRAKQIDINKLLERL